MLQVYTAEQAAQMLDCSIKTVEDMARRGVLPGIKPGGGWIFPAGALAQRLDELAIEQAARRREPELATGVTVTAQSTGPGLSAQKRQRALPKLVDLTGAAR